MYSKAWIPVTTVLALASNIIALSCDDATITITSAADATTIASCDTVGGSVHISGSGSTIDLSGDLTSVSGDLAVENNGEIISLQSTSLKKIGGDFRLRNVTLLSTLKFTALSAVGSIDWATLATLSSFSFGTPGVTTVKNITMADTFLSNLDGIDTQSLDTMDLNNNHRLTNITLRLQSLTNTININANGAGLNLNMPSLLWATKITAANISSFSAPLLETINGSMSFNYSYFGSFDTPQLTEAGSLSFFGNSKLTNISMPRLMSLGGDFTSNNNTSLDSVSFSALTNVTGDVSVNGSSSLDCAPVQELVSNRVVHGNVSCAGAVLQVATASTLAPGSTTMPNPALATTSPQTGLSVGAQAGIGVGVGVPAILAILGVITWVRLKRKTRGTGENTGSENLKPAGLEAGEKPELHGKSIGTGFARQEIDGQALGELDAGPRGPTELPIHERDGNLEDGHSKNEVSDGAANHKPSHDTRYELA